METPSSPRAATRQREEAIGRQAFGAPRYVGGEPFRGQGRLDVVARKLAQ